MVAAVVLAMKVSALFLIAALGDARDHALRIENAAFFHHVAGFDAGGFFDKGGAGQFQSRHAAVSDGGGVVGIELLGVSIEALHQLIVRDRLGWRIESGTANDGLFHS